MSGAFGFYLGFRVTHPAKTAKGGASSSVVIQSVKNKRLGQPPAALKAIERLLNFGAFTVSVSIYSRCRTENHAGDFKH